MKKLFISLAIAISAIASCNRAEDPICIILDTDIGSSTDDIVAMKMLYDYANAGKVDILAMMVDRPGAHYADYLLKFNSYYGFKDIPVGVVKDFPEPWPFMFIPYAEADVLPPYFETMEVTPFEELPESVELYKDILMSHPAGTIDIISIGFLTNIARLVEKYPEAAARVRTLYIMGASKENRAFKSYNFYCDNDATCSVLQKWEGPIKVSPGEVGREIDYVFDDVMEDYTAEGPVGYAYLHTDTDTGQRMWDPLSVIECVEPESLDFQYSPAGKYVYLEDGSTIFQPMEGGNMVFHDLDAENLAKAYEIIRSHGDKRN